MCERECVCVRESGSVVCVCVYERERVWVCERVCVCEREFVRVWVWCV